MRGKKTILTVAFWCIAIGVIYGIAANFPKEQAKQMIIGIAACVVVIWMTAKIIAMHRLTKMVAAPIPFLYEEKDPERYVEEMQKVIEKTTNRQQKDLIKINIGAGYVYAGKYDKAIDTLNQIALPGQAEVNQVLVCANKAMAFFLAEKKEEVLELVEKNRSLLKKYQISSNGLTNNIVVTLAIEQYEKAAYEETIGMLDKLKEKKVSSILQDVIDFIYCECYRNLHMQGERATLKKVMKEGKLVPAIAKRI